MLSSYPVALEHLVGSDPVCVGDSLQLGFHLGLSLTCNVGGEGGLGRIIIIRKNDDIVCVGILRILYYGSDPQGAYVILDWTTSRPDFKKVLQVQSMIETELKL